MSSITISEALIHLSKVNSSALLPLRVNPTTGEVFLPLDPPSPHTDTSTNIIITPPRLALNADSAAILPILNDPKVHVNLPGAPYPHTLDHARRFLESCNVECEGALRELVDLATPDFEGNKGKGKRGPTGLPLVSACPVRILREVRADGTDVYIGDIGCTRYNFFHVADPEEARRLREGNIAHKVSDPKIVWSIGSKFSRP